MTILRVRTIACAAALFASAAVPARADSTGTGIAAALGLSAADGKTTLGTDAGVLESELLDADALNIAGATIAALVNQHPGYRIMIVNRTDPVAIAHLFVISADIDRWNRLLTGRCPTGASGNNPLDALIEGMGTPMTWRLPSPAAQDVPAATATTQTFGAISYTVDDRLLMQAITINQTAAFADAPASADPAPGTLFVQDQQSGQRRGITRRSGTTGSGTYISPSEAQLSATAALALQQDNPDIVSFVGRYRTLLALRRRLSLPACHDRPGVKDDLTAADAFIAGLNNAAAGSSSALEQAIQLDAALGGAAQHGAQGSLATVRVLRVSIERAGGTSLTRSSIWYTLGFPGAATVRAGLLVTFRLINPADGSTEQSGMVRCMTPFYNIRSVGRVVVPSGRDRRQRGTICAYMAG